jgi:hypothetical protein
VFSSSSFWLCFLRRLFGCVFFVVFLAVFFRRFGGHRDRRVSPQHTQPSNNPRFRDNLVKVVWTTPMFSETFAEAIAGEGFSTSEYYAFMAKDSSWGGMIEICAVAEMFHVNIEVLVSISDPLPRFNRMGTFKYSLNDARTTSLYLLYTTKTLTMTVAHTSKKRACMLEQRCVSHVWIEQRADKESRLQR